jgi:hypothetical protein
LSFFDEVDESLPPPAQPRRRRPSRPPGGGRRPPSNQQAIQTRRAVVLVVLLIVIILIALGVHSCQVSATNSALKDYTNHVSSLVTQSNQTGSQLFGVLSGGGGSANATNIQTQIDAVLGRARRDLSQARNYSSPDQVKSADEDFRQALRMREDGITNIATEIQPALGNAASQTAVTSIAAEMARFYASDVVYKDYVATQLAAALHANGIAVGPPNGATIAGGQFLPNLQWLTPSYIAGRLHVAFHGGKVASGTHGHTLVGASVSGTALSTSTTNTVPSSPAPTFTLDFTNGGSNNEFNVVCKVTVTGTSVTGQATVPETFAGKSASCPVTLSSSPTPGLDQVVATIEKVGGEKNTANNTLTFPVSFQ